MSGAVLWEEVGWPDLEAYLRRDDRAIIPVGSCEQHGPHLSYATDYLIPTEIARRVSDATGVPVTPTLCFGMSLHHMEFPGTISLSPDTFVAVLRDITESLYRHGFRRLLILNGHGGNINPIGTALSQVVDRHRDLRIKVGHWWQHPDVQQIMRRHWNDVEYHAAAGETSAILAIRPQVPKLQRAAYSAWRPGIEYLGPRHWKALFPHGAIGVDPAKATAEIGEQLLATAAARFAKELDQWEDL